MALFKKITNPKGVVSEYHKIMSVSCEAENNDFLTVRTGSFASQDYRDANVHNYVGTDCFYIPVAKEELESTPILKLAYSKLKETELYKGAEDV